ncbi:MAG TPA: hypothetical protein VL285_00900 [Bryobacteraceae bacterium]|jgi:hypothetical protein|nr:hypothetical protein [Bryobacteraceae bacterium]
MSRAFLSLLFVSGLWAQSSGNPFDKAPPEVDAALRERIGKFYQAHVDKKPRLAEPYVAEDTKDFFYETNKPPYLAFEIDRIVYSENFTKANAIVKCKMYVPMPGFTEPIMVPTPSTWKVENGQWFWYVDTKHGKETPFGRMKAAEGTPPGGGGGIPIMGSQADFQALWSQSVKADKSAVQLSATEDSSEEVTIASKMPGSVTLRLDYVKTPGFEATLDRAELKTGEQAKVRLRSQPKGKPAPMTAQVRVVIEPMNQTIPITVTIQ